MKFYESHSNPLRQPKMTLLHADMGSPYQGMKPAISCLQSGIIIHYTG